MKVLEDLGLIFGWNFFPPANMLKVARLFWFGTFLAVEAKEGTILLGEVSGEQVCDRCALLTTKQTSFRKISFASTGLELLPFGTTFFGRSTRGGRVRFSLLQCGTIAKTYLSSCDCILVVGISIPWCELGNSVSVAALENVVVHFFEEASDKLDNLMDLDSANVRSVVSSLNQVDVYSVRGVDCQLRENLLKHV